MYDRLLKLLEAKGRKQPELRRDSPTSMAGGVGSGPAPNLNLFFHPTQPASLGDPQERSLLLMQSGLREIKDQVVRCQASLVLDDHR